MPNILIGVSGGIAAYKSAYIVRLLQKAGHHVRVIMTSSAAQFVTPLTFKTLSGFPVYGHSDVLHSEDGNHINLSKWADIIVVAPATANTVAKMAHGLADNLLTAVLLAAKCPVIIFPSMNENMYKNPATQANLTILRNYGVKVVTPVSGELVCGDIGMGRMPEPDIAVGHIQDSLKQYETAGGIRVLVTAGPTVEDIDPVRYISNRSSGKMGYAIAEAAAFMGAEVTLISGPTHLQTPVKNTVKVRSAAEMLTAVYSRVIGCDIFIMAAAVSDFAPLTPVAHKIKKDENERIVFELGKTDDILKSVSALKRPHQIFVGFAAESDNINANAIKKMSEKRLDFVAGNDISREDIGFDVDDNEVTLFFANGAQEYISKRSKQAVAEVIFDRATALFLARDSYENK
ncbi:MAG: bifunctional phosphopantothenoylcysteine decarboxylase/phosphopantothenate--cysteine ligase CoaBC [Deferribacteraceae bacterium]|jgi:phosphopantothenoylcysteine decarboxylase/phosphopantothenate--cysteine ligase|nr:bifunctional phosphopantothenoylcysteine decarboxylase/phosphopantothenate--cysteine ligase CoaBC [Deferribacteraceae bacterium]